MNAPIQSPLIPDREEMVQAYQRADPSYDGAFIFAVRTTGIFCRPSCNPPRLPLPKNVEFFRSSGEALKAGYRPCKRCLPLEVGVPSPDWVKKLMAQIEADPGAAIRSKDLLLLGVSAEQARRWFLEHHGMTFTEWHRSHRLALAFTKIQQGGALDDAAYENGWESLSGFREAFSRTFGKPPGGETQCVLVAFLETPIGRMIAGTTSDGICLLDYADKRTLARSFAETSKRLKMPVLPGTHPLLEQLRDELGEYFEGRRKQFTVPVAPEGTAFQLKVWGALRDIPFGQTLSYEALARKLGQPTATRAVARANATNRINILIPCHRVIASTGELSGYGGGVWRKRHLLHLENGQPQDLG